MSVHSQFGKVVPGEGFLSRSKRREEYVEAATQYADDIIRSSFRAWDTTTWIGSDVPPSISRAWINLAQGRYMQIEWVTGPEADRGDSLIREAMSTIKDLKESGGPIDRTGEIIQKRVRSEIGGGFRTMRIERA